MVPTTSVTFSPNFELGRATKPSDLGLRRSLVFIGWPARANSAARG